MHDNTFLHQLHLRAAGCNARVAFPDALDIRTLEAASALAGSGILRPILVGSPLAVRDVAAGHGISLQNVEIIDPVECSQRPDLVQEFMSIRPGKVTGIEEAKHRCSLPLIAAGMLLSMNEVDAVVAGSVSSTSDVLRAALATVRLSPGVTTLSSYFLMIVHGRVMAFADCAVVPEPTAHQLCDIAYSTSVNLQRVAQADPRVAFLSFSTKGSAESASVQRVRDAAQMFLERHTDIPADGELQADAALVPDVASRKAPNSPLHGDANVLVFPNLDAGNIGYKLTERLAGAVALGPIVQGLSKPYCDLSRGCTADDIRNVACIAVLMSQTVDTK